MIPFITPNKNERTTQTHYYDGSGKISEYKPLPPQYTWGMVLNRVDGHYYVAAMSKGGPPLNRSHYVLKYDKATNQVVQEAHIPKDESVTSAYDSHPAPVIHCDEMGHVYTVVERTMNSTGSSNGHNSDLLVYRTGTPGDLTTMFLWQELPGRYSYPKIWSKNSVFHIGGRAGRAVPTDLGRWCLEQSKDGGETWTERIVLDLPDTSPIKRAYARSIYDYDNQKMINVLNIRNDLVGAFENLSVLVSDLEDGDVWSNWDGGFSKNTATNGFLTLADIENNMMVWRVNPNVESVVFEGGAARNGEIKLLAARSTTTGVIVNQNAESKYQELRLYNNKGQGWSFVDVTFVVPNSFVHFQVYEPILQYVNTKEADYIYVMDRRVVGNCVLHEYRSTDDFATHTKREVWAGAGNFFYAHMVPNAETLDEQIVLFLDVRGSYNNTSHHSNLLFINP